MKNKKKVESLEDLCVGECGGRMSDKEVARMLIEEQCHYDIITCPFPQGMLGLGDLEFMGLADDSCKKVYLWDKQGLEEKRLTVIHEALHTHAYLNCLNWGEKEINRRSREIFRQIYGFRTRV